MSLASDGGVDLRTERNRFVGFAFAAADLLLEADDGRIVRFASGAARQLTGEDAGRLLGRSIFDIVDPGDHGFLAAVIDRLQAGMRIEPVGIRLRAGPSKKRAAWLAGCRLPGESSPYYLTLSTSRPALVDNAPSGPREPATGLLAFSDFQTKALNRVLEAPATGAKPTLTLLELQGIGELQSSLDQRATDALLSGIGSIMRAASLHGDLAGRLGDEKFGIVHDPSVEPAAIEQRVVALAREADPKGAGLAISRQTLDLTAAGLDAKDTARALAYTLFKFSTAGAGSFSISSLESGLKELLADTVSRIAEVRSTVDSQAFQIFLQPIVGMATRAIHHYEALSRTADGGSPVPLIAFAEAVDIIDEFDLAVCRRITDLLRQCEGAGPLPQIAVNLSGRSLASDSFIEALRDLLDRNGSVRRNLVIELTESTEITDLARAANIVQQFRRDGHKVCLDDFGAGAASFPYLQALAVDYVKIDGAYVRKVLTAERDRAILRAMVALCRDLRINTVAEMIETEDQAQAVRSFGVDLGQGYLFGRPEIRRPADLVPPPVSSVKVAFNSYSLGGYVTRK